MTLELLVGKSVLTLPLLNHESIESLNTAQPEIAAIPAPLSITWQRPIKRERKITHDEGDGTVSRVYLKDDGAFRIEEHGMEIDARGRLTYRSTGEDPGTAEAAYYYHIKHARGDWNASVECDMRVTADAENFYLAGEYRAIENNQAIKRRAVNLPVKRKFV
jgi:hypothetical protein